MQLACNLPISPIGFSSLAEERTLGSDQTTLRDLSDSLMPKMPKAGDLLLVLACVQVLVAEERIIQNRQND